MKKTLPTIVLLTASLMILIGATGLEASEKDHWPPPFTAEQIRDEWTEGFWLDTRVTTEAGTQVSRTEVLKWSETSVELHEVPLEDSDAGLRPAGDAGPTQSVQWQELSDHALFPRALTERRRETQPTALGELEGWVFRLTASDGSTSEFFFADRYPGPPVSFIRWQDGKQIFKSEQVSRSTWEKGDR